MKVVVYVIPGYSRKPGVLAVLGLSALTVDTSPEHQRLPNQRAIWCKCELVPLSAEEAYSYHCDGPHPHIKEAPQYTHKCRLTTQNGPPCKIVLIMAYLDSFYWPVQCTRVVL